MGQGQYELYSETDLKKKQKQIKQKTSCFVLNLMRLKKREILNRMWSNKAGQNSLPLHISTVKHMLPFHYV